MLVRSVSVRDVLPLLEALTAELALADYGDAGTFGYSVEQIEATSVSLVGASIMDTLVGVGGIEIGADGTAELKRFYVLPEYRGSGAASAIMTELLNQAVERGVRTVRLETGDKQHAAIRFYSRHGFKHVARFGLYVDSSTSVCMALSVPPTSVS